jgi:drug/metabolite transporter (DMT)-like permease
MRSARVYGVFCLVCAVFGTTFLAIKMGVSAGAPPFLFAGLRFAAAGAGLGLGLIAARRASFASLAALAPRAALLSLPYIAFNFGATFWAEQYIGSGAAAQIDAACPIASALLSALFLGKKLKASHALGIAAGFAGVWLLVGAAGARASSAGGGLGIAASIVMLAAAIGFAGASILYKRLFDDSVDSFQVNAINMLSGGIVLLVLAALTGQSRFPATPAALLPLAYLIVVGSLVGHSANLWLVRKAGPLFASSWSYVSPVIATAVGAAALGEGVSARSGAGALLTLFGVYVIARAERRSIAAAASVGVEAPHLVQGLADLGPGGARLGGPADRDRQADARGARHAKEALDARLVEPADHAGPQAELDGAQAKLGGGDADVDQGPVAVLGEAADPV